MRLSPHIALILFIFMTFITGKDASAQDILSSTGSSTRSYSYLEVQYLTNVDQSTPFVVTGLLDLSRGFALTGQYTNQSEQLISDSADLTGEARTDLFILGLLYHNRIGLVPNTDWFVELGLGHLQLDVDTSIVEISQGVLIGRAVGGFRHTFSERVEAQVSAEALYADGTDVTNESIDLTVSATAVFRVLSFFDLALSVNEVPSANIFGLGFRFTWF